MAGGDWAPSVGDAVAFVDMPDASLDGCTGKLVKLVGRDRWVVSQDGEEKTRVVTTRCLQRLALKKAAAGSGPEPYSICGTWDDWDLHEMRWLPEQARFEFAVTLRNDQESFRLVVDGDWDRCLHPDRHDASPYDGHALQGPDDGGLDESWTIGHHAKDGQCKAGDVVIVRLEMADGVPRAVTWAPKQPVAPEAPPSAAPAPEPGLPAREAPQAVRPEARWTPPEDVNRAAEARKVAAWEKEARERLARRLEAAEEEERLAIKDEATTRNNSDWEALLRKRKMKDAIQRLDEAEAAEAEAEAAEASERAREESTPSWLRAPGSRPRAAGKDVAAQIQSSSAAAAAAAAYYKAAYCGPPKANAGPGGPAQQPFVPNNPQEAWDHYWTFKEQPAASRSDSASRGLPKGVTSPRGLPRAVPAWKA